jgi:hypothetical protein
LMDKHTKRYLYEYFNHVPEQIGMKDIMGYISEIETEEDAAYIQSAIDSEFEGVKKTYLTTELFNQVFKRRG